MDFGVLMFATDYAIRPDDLARAAEERGFESLWFPEHTHIPASRRSPWPGGPELPKEYWHTHDLFVAMTMAAAVTKKLKVGSGICLVIERDPIVLAKEVATLDALSNGRLLFGIGGGWNAEEMENHGTNFKTRWKRLRESIEAMKAIWANDNAEYHGELINFDPLWSWPKPTQKPHPPIYLGGHGEKALKRVVKYCDGWMPIGLRAGDMKKEIAALHALAKAAGRDPKSIAITLYGVPSDADVIRSYADMGIHRVSFALPPADRDTVLPLLDRYAEVMRQAR
ncbi:MAG: LLM class F420-dependent oxidoreductase [Deltaproteobacteria bacterium]|nr:LLM class F420-dependent oxidoreductase [Deltaproteobacteria bacterium]MBI3389150.1 LLM class F420-dependent oxidoreductase [Deltaproteobacteria bacterium]